MWRRSEPLGIVALALATQVSAQVPQSWADSTKVTISAAAPPVGPVPITASVTAESGQYTPYMKIGCQSDSCAPMIPRGTDVQHPFGSQRAPLPALGASSLYQHLTLGFVIGFGVGAVSALGDSACHGGKDNTAEDCRSTAIGLGIVGGAVGAAVGGVDYVVRRVR